MKKQFLNKLTTLTAFAVMGTTLTLMGSQTAGQADSLTTNALNHQTVSDVTVQALQPVLQTDRATEPDIKVSRSIPINTNEILKTLEPMVGRENTVPKTPPTRRSEGIQPTPSTSTETEKNKPVTRTSISPKKPNVNRVANKQVRRRQGIASWYGPGFHGRRTASGETFNAGGLTAAHRSLPFGTRVRVTNVRNGRSVVVRINDRGPFSGGRVIDLSRGAARIIGVFQAGAAPVLLEILGR